MLLENFETVSLLHSQTQAFVVLFAQNATHLGMCSFPP